MTDDTDTYYGANAMVLLPPSDPSVNLTLMTTKDHNDTRDNARNTLEQISGPRPEVAGGALRYPAGRAAGDPHPATH